MSLLFHIFQLLVCFLWSIAKRKNQKNCSSFLKDQVTKNCPKESKSGEELSWHFFVSVGNNPGVRLGIAAKLGIGIGGGAVVLIIIVLLAFAFLQKKRADKAVEHQNPFGMQFLPSILQLWQTILYIYL